MDFIAGIKQQIKKVCAKIVSPFYAILYGMFIKKIG
jgi:hypothetical protein